MAGKLESFGSSIPPLAGKQLKVREELYSKSSKNLQNLQAINSNTAWVVLRSSVNEVTNKEVLNSIAKGKTSTNAMSLNSKTASNFILTGGRAANFFNKSVQGINLFGKYSAFTYFNSDHIIKLLVLLI